MAGRESRRDVVSDASGVLRFADDADSQAMRGKGEGNIRRV